MGTAGNASKTFRNASVNKQIHDDNSDISPQCVSVQLKNYLDRKSLLLPCSQLIYGYYLAITVAFLVVSGSIRPYQRVQCALQFRAYTSAYNVLCSLGRILAPTTCLVVSEYVFRYAANATEMTGNAQETFRNVSVNNQNCRAIHTFHYCVLVQFNTIETESHYCLHAAYFFFTDTTRPYFSGFRPSLSFSTHTSAYSIGLKSVLGYAGKATGTTRNAFETRP